MEEKNESHITMVTGTIVYSYGEAKNMNLCAWLYFDKF